jgi:radical SAM protein with 4Fe4S-binding SPASM domain
MKTYVDKKNKFIEMFDEKTGFYIRSGIIENGKDTGVDPFMRNFPQLIDIGIMGSCVHGSKGLCIKGGVECYQNGFGMKRPNMSLDNFKSIVEECKDKTFQFALGGRGDVDQHENFEEILSYCREKEIVPNFTSSGLGFTPEIVDICKKYCGAVAISWYRQSHTYGAISMLLNAGIKTNIHYVLGNNSIDEAIERLTNNHEKKDNSFPEGVNAVIFLLHKPVGLGTEDNVLTANDEKVKRFFELVDNGKFSFKIGFDSCNIPAILNFNKNIVKESIDTCEAGRHSMYITSEMIAIPCSFDNQDLRWGYDLKTGSIQECWNSPQFNDFRSHFKTSCLSCKDRLECLGGCPIRRQIVLCERPEKDLK